MPIRPFDLGAYHLRFPEVVRSRYGQNFTDGFRDVEKRFRRIRSEMGPCKSMIPVLVKRLPADALPQGMSRKQLIDLWSGRNVVMHEGEMVDQPVSKRRAAEVVEGVADFMQHNSR